MHRAVACNDATGIGVANDVLLAFLAVGFLATHLATEAPAPPGELADAWNDVVASLAAVGTEARALSMSLPMPPMNDCTAHLGECLSTPLGRKHSGGKWNRSICSDCLERCRGDGWWPDVTIGGKFVPILEARGETWRAQELRRRVAEDILGVAIDHRHPPTACETLLGRVIELGFGDLRSKADVLLMFGGYCARQGSKQLVPHYLVPLKAELEAEYERTQDAVLINYLHDCQRFLDMIEGHP